MNYTSTINIPQFREDLITWFEKEQRSLPWRENRDPYRVWVSEIMLQQTKVDTVIPYFKNFIDHFPTLSALANANEQEVLKAWEGLGYYSRARNLQTAVKEVVEQYDAKVPDDPRQLGDLKGVGPYTKGAILSIAYGIPEPAVDGNVMRVLSRILRIEEDIAKPKTRKTFEAAVRDLISSENPSAFNQGLMELGALICTPKSPSCLLCPVQEHCTAFRDGVEQSLPIKKKKTKQSVHTYFALVVEDDTGKFILEQRPNQGLLAQLWQFPMVKPVEVGEHYIAAYVEEKFDVKVSDMQKLETVKHVFSHLTWFLEVRYIRVKGTLHAADKNMVLVTKEEMTPYPLPVSHQNIYKQLP
ncbi:A/G-specific adenine glycosylase [Gracilibacillus caseinilyticus]|uniref:Adenine DNA glycosylase n=1 Tax=Gracilibacillus caseinilyticus TaxID=2932256 RepID=A0ABY4EX23_9BACI|nr:A/G-specific adenine glycosylase [Gracilibacillus caseinilyticus]UOQ48825.1 A/G-specific adenine glycosylase [Gracilibacillus caseinilyticus]